MQRHFAGNGIKKPRPLLRAGVFLHLFPLSGRIFGSGIFGFLNDLF